MVYYFLKTKRNFIYIFLYMENIIVYGIKRSGTSLMTQLIAENSNYIINKDDQLENNKNYDDLQKYYNEGIFIDGINDENIFEYNKINNNVIKFMHSGLNNTDLKHFNTFKKIIIMNRDWRDQVSSANNLEKINIKNDYELIKNRINNISIDEYFEDYKYDDGVEYGYYYSNLLIDIIKRKYHSKVIFVDFNVLINNTNLVLSTLNKFNLILNEYDIIDKKQSKYISSNKKKKKLKEFKKGYFSFLDELNKCFKISKIDNMILELINEWMPHIIERIKVREKNLYNKYKIIYK